MTGRRVTVRPGGNLALRDATGTKLFLAPGDQADLTDEAVLLHLDRLIIHDPDWFTSLAPTRDDRPAIAYRKGRPKPGDAVQWPVGLTIPGRPEVTAVLYTNRARPRQRVNRTLQSLKRVGVYPIVFSSTQPPSPSENRRAAWHALLRAYTKAENVLILEDDIDASEVFRLSLFQAVMLDAITYLYNPSSSTPNAVKTAMRKGENLECGPVPYPLERPTPRSRQKPYRDAIGSQAVYLPQRVLEAIIEDPEWWAGPQPSFDIALRQLALRHMPDPQFTPHISIPNAIQHQNEPTLVSTREKRPEHTSDTFGYPYRRRPRDR